MYGEAGGPYAVVSLGFLRKDAGMEIPFSAEVREAMAEALAAGGFPSIDAAAWEVSLTVGLSKVSAYERECEHFRRKYGKSLEAFRGSVEEMRGSEDFAMEDDLADWEFAERALQLWQRRVEILRHAAV
jgi:hypothetical protein